MNILYKFFSYGTVWASGRRLQILGHIQKGGFEDENDDMEEEILSHDVESIEHVAQGRLEEWLVCAIKFKY